MYRLQRQKKRQVIISTHSADLLSDKGIAGEETLLLIPDIEGTRVEVASDVAEVRGLLEAGLSVADAALPRTAPSELRQFELGFFE